MPTSSTHRRFEISASPEAVLVCAAVFWMFAANTMFFRAALRDQVPSSPATMGYLLALAVAVVGVHAALLGLVVPRLLIKPVLAVLTVAAAAASHYMATYGVYMDPDMLRNVLKTHPAETRELLSASLVWHMLVYAGLPLLMLWRVSLRRPSWRQSLARRSVLVIVSLVVVLGSLLAVMQPFASLMRNHKQVRYLITPVNLVYSTTRAATFEAKTAIVAKTAIGLDAKPGPSWATQSKPKVLVLVVGETARAANWGLSGYGRQTTPQLAQLPVINFSQVTSCGTNTEVSLPCMFSQVGRRDYNETRIRGQESLLHVLARAGVGVDWRDNQSGCKGVCDDLPNSMARASAPETLCDRNNCLDEALIHDIDARLAQARGTQLWVFHQLGSHGPSYFRRYPPQFAQFKPVCEQDELGRCELDAIVNAYDNTLLYTDHLLATVVQRLQAHANQVDGGLLYVSDHGESLGEQGLFLHGIPFAIAPKVQTQVPMVMWFSQGFAASIDLSLECLTRRAQEPASHDHLFHTVLALLDVKTALKESTLDLTAACRRAM